MTQAAPSRAKPFLIRLGLRKLAAPAKRCDDGSGLPFDSDAPQRRREAVAIGAAAGAIAEKLGLRPEAGAAPGAMPVEDEIAAAWRKAAGDLADSLVPEKYVGGILYVLGGSTAEIFEIRRTRLRGIEQAARRLAPFAALRQIRIKSDPRAAMRQRTPFPVQ